MKTKKIITAILLGCTIGLGFYIYNLLTYKYINIEFGEMRPIHEKVNIFYKGIKIGYVRKFEIAHHGQSTIAKSVITHKTLMLPVNTIAKLKKEKKHKKEYDFIELTYPENPSHILLSNGSYISGKSTVDVDTYMANQDADDIEKIKQNLLQSTEELETVLSSLSELFVTLDDIAKENKKNISVSTRNLSETTKNINQLTSKVNKSLNQQQLDNSVSNINSTLENLSKTTLTVDQVTQSLNTTVSNVGETTIPQVQSTLYRTECLVANVNEITCGIKETLKKRFGGLRILFGQVIQK